MIKKGGGGMLVSLNGKTSDNRTDAKMALFVMLPVATLPQALFKSSKSEGLSHFYPSAVKLMGYCCPPHCWTPKFANAITWNKATWDFEIHTSASTKNLR